MIYYVTARSYFSNLNILSKYKWILLNNLSINKFKIYDVIILLKYTDHKIIVAHM